MNTESYLKMMSAWLDAAKACGQLAMAATFLPIFFLRQVGGLAPAAALTDHLSPWHIACWALLGLSIGLALLYQFTVARLMQSALVNGPGPILFPRVQFWTMVLSLLAGIACFVIGVIPPR